MTRYISALRIALGVVFFWFGALKLAGVSPATDVIYASFPFLAEGIGLIALGLFEVLIGLALVFNVLPILISMAMILHLFGTLLVFVIAPGLAFVPYFPILSLTGEFILKNIVLVLAGFVVLKYNQNYGN
jgi:uncharacterized membrane protein YkgB